MKTREKVGLLTEDEQKILALLMQKRARNPRQRVIPELFFASLKMHVSPSSEVVFLKKDHGKLMIYLTKRPATDPFYPDQWHFQGVMLFYDELIRSGAFRAIKEVSLSKKFDPVYRRYFEWSNGKKSGQNLRGHSICFLHTVIINKKEGDLLKGGCFFPINRVPRSTVEIHKRMISWLVKNL